MIEVDYKDKKVIDSLYGKIRQFILSNKGMPKYSYSKHQHHLYEESDYPGISKGYYNETGSFEFENNNGKTIILEIDRWHPHKHNGWSGLNGNPCLNAQIYVLNSNEKQLLWELKVVSGTLHWEAEVTSLEFPKDFLIPKKEEKEEEKEEEKIIETIVDDKNAEIKQEIIDDRNLFDELTKAHKQYSDANERKSNVILERKNAIEKAKEQIITEYRKKVNDCDGVVKKALSDLNSYEKLISKYSTFNQDMISVVITELVKIIEGKEFLYKTVVDKYKNVVHGPMDSWDENVERKVKIIVDSNKAQDFYDNSYAYDYKKYISKIDQLVEDGYAILLSGDNSKNITFLSSEDGQISYLVNFGKFDYIKDFVDELIQYRFQRRKDDIAKEDIILCMQKFISKYEEQIAKNYVSNVNARVLKLSL